MLPVLGIATPLPCPEPGMVWLLGGLAFALSTIPVRKPARMKQRELSLLRKISSMVNRSVDLSTVLASTLDELMALLGMEAGTFRIVTSDENLSPVAVYRGFSKDTVSVLEAGHEQGGQVRVRLSDEALVIDSTTSPDALSEALRNQGLQYFALYPVRSGNRLLGTLGLASHRPKAINEAQEDLLQTLTEILGVAIVNVHLREQAGKLSEDLVALQEVNKIISQSFDLEDIIQRIVVEGRRLVKTNQCHLFLLDDRQPRLVGAASTQTERFEIRQVEIALTEKSIAITSLLEKRVIAVEEMPHGDRMGQRNSDPLSWRSAIFAPLIAKDQAIGVLICSDNARERGFTDEEILRAETLAHQAAIALENARLFQVVSRSQKEWETTFDAMQDCVSVHDTTGKIIRANLALARRLRTTPPKIIGKYCCELFHTSGNGARTCRHMDSIQAEGLLVEEVELPVMGGTYQISVGPWYDKNNRLAGSIHVAKDISNEKLLQQQLIQSEKLSAIGELISGIAHELNNPLTGVMGYSQLLQLRKDLDDRARDSLLKINNLALRCQKIVKNLLSFARKQKPERRLSDINEILDRTVELRNYELQVNNIEIFRDLDRELPKTIADAHQLQQVFLNVVTNAEQAMLDSNGRGKLMIRTRADIPGGRIAVEITDDGPGIPEPILTKIFDPFFTTKEVGKGTGLGLSLSYGIIKEHGGNIYARSRMGEGSTFVIEIPIISVLTEEPEVPAELMPRALHFENLVRGKKMLVVDDEKYILDFFVEVFQPYPISVDTASNGRAAMEKIRDTSYDLVVTDFKMPQMSGRDLFEWIKNERPSLASRIIFVTGDTVSTETRSFFENNSNRYLAKPFRIEDVKEVIQQTLEDAL
jgi:two-component system, NtrC family, sensor kinase